MSDTECPTCGRDDFASRKGMKHHHARTHDEVLKWTVECAQCGDEKEVSEHQAARRERHFCDEHCYTKWRGENWQEENSPAWDGGKTPVECAYCGEEKELQQWELDQSDRYFCDQTCQGKWWSERRTAPVAGSWEVGGVAVECAHCSNEKKVKPAHAEKFQRHFCDHGCLGEWRSEHRSGENHPQWNGGPVPYGENWTEDLKERVRDRQNRQCADCGTHESELSMKLDVHHIMKARDFDNDAERNAESNLVGLCRSCHSTWEKMSPLRPQVAD